MSRKTSIFIISICLLILSMVLSSIPIAFQDPAATKLSISPASIIGPPPDVGESFNINITIEDSINVTGLSIGLTWNPNVLECLSFTTQFGTGTFLGPSANWIGLDGTIDNINGQVYPPSGYAITDVKNAPSGSGTLVKAVFKVTDYGFTWINLTNIMIEENKVIMPVDLTNCTFALFTAPPAAPVASFDYSPPAPKMGQMVTFDASASVPGWNGTANVTIADYTWDFDDGNTTTTTNPIISHTYAINDTYTVNLTVTCEDDPMLISMGLTSNSTWQDVTIMGPVHDVAVTNVTPYPTEVIAGKPVTVNVIVKNIGNFTETFNVTAYYDNTEIGTQTATNLASGANETLTFTWYTAYVDEGDYTIKAVADTVAGETETADNTLIDGTVTVKATKTKLSISPATIIGPPPGIGENFTVEFYIENVINLTGFQIGLQWDPNVLECLNFTTQFGTGTFLGPAGNWIEVAGAINNTAGEIYPPYGYVFFGATPPNGSGTIAQVNFTVLDYGFTWINLNNIMIESFIQGFKAIIPVNLINGTFALTVPAAPVASFDYSPSDPDVGEQVTFDASASVSGWNGTAYVPIANYTWDFGDGTPIVTETDPITTHTYTANDTYTVSLTITCEEDPRLINWTLTSNSTSKSITITAVPVVLVHDVAVTSVAPSTTKVTEGDSVTITVIVKNEGDYTESFNVTVSYDNTAIDTKVVTNLVSGATKTLTFTWDTTDVDKGDYKIKAVAETVAEETDTADNTLIDGTVKVKAPAPEMPWLLIILVIIVIVAIIIIAYWLMRRKKMM